MCNNCNIAYTISIFYTLLINTCNQYNRFFVCDLNIVKKLTTKLEHWFREVYFHILQSNSTLYACNALFRRLI